MGGERQGASTDAMSSGGRQGRSHFRERSRSVQTAQGQRIFGSSPVEQESGVLRALRGVTNCPVLLPLGPSGDGLHNYGTASGRTDKHAFHLAGKSIRLLPSPGTILHFPWTNKGQRPQKGDHCLPRFPW